MSTSTLLKNCKLTYFDLTGRGEAARLALTLGKVPFDDERISFSDWKDKKSSTPYGGLPILTLNPSGTVIAQQRAILRLIGKETGLYPVSDHVKAAKIDELMDAIEDIGQVAYRAGQGLDKEEFLKARTEACKEGGTVYETLQKLNNQLAGNNFCVGDSLTIADLILFTSVAFLVSGFMDGIPSTTIDPFDNIMGVRKMVRAIPEVEAWYDSHDKKLE